MIIENYKGKLEIDPDTKLSIERTNPLLSEQGSSSLPCSIKLTKHNNYCLDFPTHLDRKNQYQVKQPVRISAGILSENATLELLSVDKDAAEGVFYLGESSFYSQVKETNLPQIFEGKERWYSSKTTPLNTRISVMVNKFQSMIFSDINLNEDLTIFPVVLECEMNRNVPSALGPVSTADSYNIINEIVSDNNKTGNRWLRGRDSYSYKDSGNNTITVPAGYGISPFLRMRYVLTEVFKHFDLTLENSPFDTDPSLQQWCIINNTQDALMLGYLKEDQLVPDCTVNDFLDVVRKKLCCDFVIDVYRKTARIVLFNEVLDAPADMDLTPYLTSPVGKIELSAPKQIHLTINKSNDFSDSATETYEQFKQKYPNYNSSSIGLTEGIHLYALQNSIFKLFDKSEGWLINSFKTEWVTSLNFDFYTNDEVEKEEHKIPAEALGTASIMYDLSLGLNFYAPVIGKSRNLNSYVILDGTKMSEDKVECPIMISVETLINPGISTKYRAGIQCRWRVDKPSTDPEKDYDYYSNILLWGDYGLFERFWKKLDQVKRTSFHAVTYQFRLPTHILHQFRFERLKLTHGQPLIAESMKYELNDNDFIDVEILFRTVKKYE